MREIKFRAWDGEKMLYLAPLEVENENRGLILAGEVDREPKAVMQYTGLKDKNGKEIYEGDIVEFENGDIWKVYFAEGGAQFRLETPEEEDFLDMSEGMQLEVIGNVWENPDLLSNPPHHEQ